MQFRQWRGLLALMLPAGISACEVGPDYMRPAAPTEAQFKENAGWTPATPRQAAGWEEWWGIYDDPVLDALEKQVDINNQNLKEAEAAYRVSRAQVGIARSQLLPNIGANLGVRGAGSGGARGTSGTAGSGTGTGNTGTGSGAGTGSIGTGAGTGSGTGTGTGGTGAGTGATTGGGGGSSGGTTFTYSAGLAATWDIDVWGGIRRQVEADVATAQASAADIAAARLSAQAQLAIFYFQLRAADAAADLLSAAIEDFRMALTIAQNKYAAGVSTLADVSSAETSIDSATTQLVGVRLTRDTAEHAIAALTGRTPSDVEVAVGMIPMDVPVIPAGIPSTLLERRPDVAATERNVASANAGIGVAEAAWYPDITLDASYGFSASSLGRLFNASSASWAFGPSLGQTVFDGGLRISQNLQARARYDQAVAA
ncbi:MAG TPA: efflux transporter outer membrane subunit, partial [Micropepsaceae bacterium]|nr:efflux transporter outer membrane subunit [Micropepsaceae bacterium]